MDDLKNICKICGITKCRWRVCDSCKENAKANPRVMAVRSHKLVGRGSCTSIDECYDDYELLIALNNDGADTEEKSIKWALDSEGLWKEQALNCRWGEDNDPELEDFREWNSRLG